MTVTLASLTLSRDVVEPALREAVARLDDDSARVLSYHLGWCDADGTPMPVGGGKSVRPALVLLAAEAVGGTRDDAVPGAVAVELVHNFSLVHDDLMDRDTSRRHRPTVWAVWGDATAVLVGDAMLALAHEVLLESGSPRTVEASRLLAVATRELIRGQVQDVAFERRDDVTLEQCLAMADGKTGALLAGAAAVGAVMGGAAPDVVEALASYGRDVGMAFQLVDDLLGIWGTPEVTGKPVYSDLRSCKKSLPITWAVQNGGAAGRELSQWLSASYGPDGPSETQLREAAALVERGGGREWAAKEAGRRARLAEEALAHPGVAVASRDELVGLARFVVEREA
jgi:geranylgeranyl diphosphate synthase type I